MFLITLLFLTVLLLLQFLAFIHKVIISFIQLELIILLSHLGIEYLMHVSLILLQMVQLVQLVQLKAFLLFSLGSIRLVCKDC